MESSPYALGWLGIIIAMYAFLWMIRKPLKYIIGFILQLVVGGALITLCNWIFSALDLPLFVGLNVITGVLVGILGIPGVILLYILSFWFS